MRCLLYTSFFGGVGAAGGGIQCGLPVRQLLAEGIQCAAFAAGTGGAVDAAARRADTAEKAAEKTGNLLAVLRRSGFAAGQKLADLTPDTLENYPDSATRDLLRHHPFRLERLRTPQRLSLIHI